jgi:Mu transposase, C-terminal domain
MLAEERQRLHALPQVPHTVCFGQTRKVSWQSTISVGGALYSVPSALVDERVWARVDGSELVVVYADSPDGPREVARHALTTPGRPSIRDEHYPPRPAGAIERKPRASSTDEQVFLAIGAGAERWLIAAAAAGTTKLRRKLSEATALAKLHGPDAVDEALAVAADAGRFGDGDLAAILAHRGAQVIEFPARASEQQSLQRSTRSWEGFGA